MKRLIAVLVAVVASLAALSTANAAPGAACAAPAAGGSYVGTASVNSADPSGTAFQLPAAGRYNIVVCGTWVNGGYGPLDAEYVSLDNWATHMDGYDIAPYFNGPNFGDLEVNNSFVDWGSYNAAHTYGISGSYSGSMQFTVFDGNGNYGPVAGLYPGWYGDNYGSLSVDIYRALPTSADQCKNGGWQAYGIFKNQGDCVSWVATHGKNQPG